MPFPVAMRLNLTDGSTQAVHLPVTIWRRRTTRQPSVTQYTAAMPISGQSR